MNDQQTSEPDIGVRVSDEEALEFHASGRPGKLEIQPTKPLTTARDLSLAYSPGVAAPCRRIEDDPDLAYEFTAKGNLVAVVTNGSAVLGLGNLKPVAAKPVMEGKAVLFKRFADVDAIDIEVDTNDVGEFVQCVRLLGKTFGGINLEDIKAPDCFTIERELRDALDIPVFHDDQHGTAIIAAAGVINAAELTGRRIEECRLVVNGAGAAAISCVEIVKGLGIPSEHILVCDSRGVIYKGRSHGMNEWKEALAAETDKRTLSEALQGADIFFGLSVEGAMTQEMVASMSPRPIIFALANPNPEITPEEVKAVRPDAIVATGRSDYPNQVNNVLGFPYVFRGALDVRASSINQEMKIAAAQALAKLAREDVPEEVNAAYTGRSLRFGPEYIIPAPFDARLLPAVSYAVAEAAISSGVARKAITDIDDYRRSLRARMDSTAATLQRIHDHIRAHPKRVVFAEGEDESVIRAAVAFQQSGYGLPTLIGQEKRISDVIVEAGLHTDDALDIIDPDASEHLEVYAQLLYRRQQRRGMLLNECRRRVRQNYDVFAASMVVHGEADALVTGATRSFSSCFDDVVGVLAIPSLDEVFGLTVLVSGGRTLFLADTQVHERPTPTQLADFAVKSASLSRLMGHEPRVALLSFSNFGDSQRPREATIAAEIREAVSLLERRMVDFEFDGEMTAGAALNVDLLRRYPFCRLTGPANVLIMPGLHASNIGAGLLQHLRGASVLGPLIVGLERPVQIVGMGATASEITNLAALTAYRAGV